MTNQPPPRNASYRYIAFCTITSVPQARAETAKAALALATQYLPTADFIEILDCADNGEKIWTGDTQPTNPLPLYKARALHRTVFRGRGLADSYNPWPAIPLDKGRGRT